MKIVSLLQQKMNDSLKLGETEHSAQNSPFLLNKERKTQNTLSCIVASVIAGSEKEKNVILLFTKKKHRIKSNQEETT